jgi:hypothetical protein
MLTDEALFLFHGSLARDEGVTHRHGSSVDQELILPGSRRIIGGLTTAGGKQRQG